MNFVQLILEEHSKQRGLGEHVAEAAAYLKYLIEHLTYDVSVVDLPQINYIILKVLL